MEIQFNGPGPVIVPGHGKIYPGARCDLPDDQAEGLLAREDWSKPGDAAWKAVEWPLKTTPAEYLRKTPDGPKADLAREILKQEEE